MIKKELYPKTVRIGLNPNIIITEKLDGSNLGFFKLGDTLYIATRSNVFTLSEIEDAKPVLYKGLYGWLKEYGESLLTSLNDGSAIWGEWIGMGKLKYDFGNNRFFMFAKGNVDISLKVSNLKYDPNLFHYSFQEDWTPSFIEHVPVVLPEAGYEDLNIGALNYLYDQYTQEVGRNVEGFVININGQICKYVRMKNGKLADHFDRGE